MQEVENWLALQKHEVSGVFSIRFFQLFERFLLHFQGGIGLGEVKAVRHILYG